jgi:hypothetical protein
MKWVTRDYVHLDRVASPWLIKRFVDVDATFTFVPWGSEDDRPADAIPFALPGVVLGAHDARGTTFDKILAKYNLKDPALSRIARVVSLGVDHVLHDYRPDTSDSDGQIAVGLLAISEGMMLLHHDDNDIIRASLVVYDALYQNFRGLIALASQPSLPASDGKGPTRRTQFLRHLLESKG